MDGGGLVLKVLVGLLTGAVATVLLAALDHILAAAGVAVGTFAVVVTLLVFARRGIRRAAGALSSTDRFTSRRFTSRSRSKTRPARRPRVR